MQLGKSTAIAHPNIAFIKYWGNRDDALRLPANSSLSMNLDGLETETTVVWDDAFDHDALVLNGQADTGDALTRVTRHLDAIRHYVDVPPNVRARVDSANNFPTGVGIASSASSFAALTVAAVAAAGVTLTERELTSLARLGSGSASRSIPTGFVLWHAGERHEDSFAESIAPPDHWDLVDVIAVVSKRHKAVGSTAGHATAWTSELQDARVASADERLSMCRTALLERDFGTFAEVVERDSNVMHAVMMTSRPPLFYWQPASLAIMQQVRQWREDGLRVCYTLDAGPNVHCICVREDAGQVRAGLQILSDVLDVRAASPGGPAVKIR
jgi:diphosphomevalonate decarboxylase